MIVYRYYLFTNVYYVAIMSLALLKSLEPQVHQHCLLKLRWDTPLLLALYIVHWV